MNKQLHFLLMMAFYAIFFGFSGSSSERRPNDLDLVYINPSMQLLVAKAVDKQNKELLTGQMLDKKNDLYVHILSDLSFGFHRSVLKLTQSSRNFSGRPTEPNLLVISDTDGGFVRKGITITGHNGEEKDFPDLYYVDLKLDTGRVRRGEMHILSHELGHVMMQNIFPSIFSDANSKQSASKQHVGMGITDYRMAFFEGWGIHFQVFANDIPKYQQHLENTYLPERWLGSLWHSNIDREMRINSLKQNRFIYEKLLPDINPEDVLPEDLILFDHTWPVFDPLKLKNAQQLLSSEGFLATFFYRVNTNQSIANNYQDKDFYNHFLLQNLPESLSPKDIFCPFENVVLKHFYVWDSMENKPGGNLPLLIDYLLRWCDYFPEDKEELIALFIRLTNGKTMGEELADIFLELSYHGIIGDIDRFLELFDRYSNTYQAFLKQALNDPERLSANIGPELWVENTHVHHRKFLWNPDSLVPHRFNVNTASVFDLVALPDVDYKSAKNILRMREKDGFFNCLGPLEAFGL